MPARQIPTPRDLGQPKNQFGVRSALSNEQGFTIIQLAIVLVIIGIVSAMSVVRITSARNDLRLQNSVRTLAGYMERARTDAIRRHGTSTFAFVTTTSYTITMDFGGTGTTSTRTFRLEPNVTLIDVDLPSVTFNWRGRTLACTTTFSLQNIGGTQSWVDISDAGDVTVNSDVGVLPSISYTNVNGSSDVYSSAVVNGTVIHSNSADCDGTGGTVTSGSITGTGTGGCAVTSSVSALSIKKNGGTTGSMTISLSGSSGITTVTTSTVSNLTVSPATTTISGNSSATFTVRSTNSTRGTFAVTFTTSCTSVVVKVKVTN